MRQRHSSRVQNIYWFTTIGLTICAYAVQLLAGGKLITMILGYPFWLSTVVLSVIPLGYSMIFGIRASVMTDYLKMIIMIVLGAILLPLVVIKSGGIDVIIAGLGGVNGNFSNMMTSDGLTLFLTFGIPTFIGLMSGPFGDQSFWQRTFATKQSEIKKSFITGAFIFAIVPLMMGVVGFAAAGSGLKIDDPQMVNIQTIFASAGLIGVALFLIIVMSALTSIIDSKLCAISSIAGHDMSERFNLDFNILSKASMVWLTLGALLVANIPGLQILYLFLFYGTLRSSTVSITVLTLMGKKMSEVRVFYGILAAIAIGLPLFTYGNLNKNTIFIVAGSLITVLLPLIALKKHDK